MSDKAEFINFLTTSLNNEGYIVADKLEVLYNRITSNLTDEKKN